MAIILTTQFYINVKNQRIRRFCHPGTSGYLKTGTRGEFRSPGRFSWLYRVFYSFVPGRIMEHKPEFNMDGKEEDLFFLSNGHISPVFYSVLARSGYFPVEELSTFRHIDSRLQGHPTTHEGLPGIRVASGSLGQGMSVALGAAQAKKLNQDDHLVFSLHGEWGITGRSKLGSYYVCGR